jgi:tRNA(Ile)-lysidine synthase
LQGTEVLSQIGLRQWKKQYEVVKGNEIHLSKLGLKTLAHPESVLYALIKEFGFNLAQCEDIVKSLDGQSGKKFSAERYDLVIDRTEIILYKFFNAEEVFITNEANHYQLGSLNLSVWSESPPNISRAKNAATLDVSKLTFPLKWRKWKPGDSFQPLGMKQKKKLSDYFIDEKLTLADKEQATVIESRGEIVWVVGQRIDDRYKITDETTSSFILDCGF